MRRAHGILALLCLCMCFAHAQKLSFSVRPFAPSSSRATIKEFLDQINASGQAFIEYASNSIDTGKIITLQGSPVTLGAVLQQVLKGQQVSILEKNNKVILIPSSTPLPDDFLVSYFAVFGLVKEEISGEPLADATIWQPVLQKGVLSNSFGHYTLLLPAGR